VLLSVDIAETESTFLIDADITGFRADSVNVTPWQDSLIIEMETGHDPGQSYYLGELESEYYRRVIPLGFGISEASIDTRYDCDNGNLKVWVKKPIVKNRKTTKTAFSSDYG